MCETRSIICLHFDPFTQATPSPSVPLSPFLLPNPDHPDPTPFFPANFPRRHHSPFVHMKLALAFFVKVAKIDSFWRCNRLIDSSPQSDSKNGPLRPFLALRPPVSPHLPHINPPPPRSKCNPWHCSERRFGNRLPISEAVSMFSFILRTPIESPQSDTKETCSLKGCASATFQEQLLKNPSLRLQDYPPARLPRTFNAGL